MGARTREDVSHGSRHDAHTPPAHLDLEWLGLVVDLRLVHLVVARVDEEDGVGPLWHRDELKVCGALRRGDVVANLKVAIEGRLVGVEELDGEMVRVRVVGLPTERIGGIGHPEVVVAGRGDDEGVGSQGQQTQQRRDDGQRYHDDGYAAMGGRRRKRRGEEGRESR